MERRTRLRELGVQIGELPPGLLNAITDVSGVQVGHRTLISGEGRLEPGKGPVRTGVTVILPHSENLFQEKVPAATHTINGFGKVVGFEQLREFGTLEAPIALTNTLNVGLVVDALVQFILRLNPQIGIRASTVNVVVGETNDSYLNDIQGRHVRAGDVWGAIENASSGAVEEGAVGAGTGTVCMGWKGGIGTASRILPREIGGFTVGALVQSNFGKAEDLIIAGMPVGRLLTRPENRRLPGEQGSIMIVLATNAPVWSQQLERMCRRAVVGLARVGSRLSDGSGDFVVAFSTGNRIAHRHNEVGSRKEALVDQGKVMNGLFQATAECVEEAVLNSMTCARTMVGRDGNTAYGLPLDLIKRITSAYRQLHDRFSRELS